MDILSRRAVADLASWEPRPFWPATLAGPTARDRRDHYESVIAHEPPGPPLPEGPFRAVADSILRYEVFPPRLIHGVLRRAPVVQGDTVGIRYHLFVPLDLFFAARVTEVFDAPHGNEHRTGFSYRTLVGHPELGEETFAVRKHLTTGAIAVALTSWSRPGTRLARVFAPLLRALQVSGSHAALVHLATIADGATPSACAARPPQPS